MVESSIVRLYRLTYDEAPEPTVVLGSDGRVLLVNRAAQELPGQVVDTVAAHFRGSNASSCLLRSALLVRGRAWSELEVDDLLVAVDGRRHGDQFVFQLRDTLAAPLTLAAPPDRRSRCRFARS